MVPLAHWSDSLGQMADAAARATRLAIRFTLENGTGTGMRRIESRPQRAKFGPALAAINWTFMVVLLASACLAFWPVTPTAVVGVWAGLGVAQLTLWASLSLRLIPGTPSRDRSPDFWVRVGKVIALGNNMVVVLGIWLLSPYGPVELRMLAVLFCISYLAIAVFATPNFGWVHYVNTITVIGSSVAVVLLSGSTYGVYLLPFFGVFAVGILMLGHILHRKKLALGVARLEAEAQRDARMHYLASASHDFGQPLQSARLYYDQMQRSTVVADRARAARGLERALEAMASMVAQVTNHLRLDAGAVSAEREAVPLNWIIARAVEAYEPAARLKAVQLRMLPNRLVVQGDPLLIERVLGNLIGNAIRHAHASRILIGPKRRGSRVWVWVIDDGRGVALADRDGLFEAYVQGSDHAGEVRGGYGLGLSAARLMAGEMQGEAGYDPRWRKGSAFFLELPTAPPQPASSA